MTEPPPFPRVGPCPACGRNYSRASAKAPEGCSKKCRDALAAPVKAARASDRAAKKAAPKSKKPAAPKVKARGADPHARRRREYEEAREQVRARDRARSEVGRDIAPLPDIADPARRDSCRFSLRRFIETYNPEPIYFNWSDDHLRVIARMEEAALQGALFAFAMPRGSGKTLLARSCCLWVMSYAHRRYPFLIGGTEDKAREAMDTIRTFVRFLPTYTADFPEISYPFQKLQGIALRAVGQLYDGRPTQLQWAADRVVLATVPPPDNWLPHWPLRKDGMVPTSGMLVSTSGLTGEGIRGSLKTLATGEMVRPDFVILDDPQSPDSARSRAQNVTRLKLISADVLGMAGPGKSIAAVMPCTVIERGDMVDEVLDRGKHPLWRGERTRMLKTMPRDLAAWDDYFRVYARCAQLEPPDFAESNAHYEAHRGQLEAGAEAGWTERKEPHELSAVQSAMHLYFRDRRAFMAEYQNDPEAPEDAGSGSLDPAEVAARGTNLPRWAVPRGATRLVAFVDVGVHLLWYAVAAMDEGFGGHLVAYGAWPEQARAYFTKGDPRPSLGDVAGHAGGQDAALFSGLTALAEHLLGRTYRQEETGAEFRVERCLVDANYGPVTDLVYQFCRRSAHAAVLTPSHGKFVGASSTPMAAWPRRKDELAMPGAGWWRLTAPAAGRGRHLVFDTNAWKTFAADRLRTPMGVAGCLLLHAPGGGGHQLYADHCAAEFPVPVARAGGRTVEEWKERPNRDNDLFDCTVGCMVAASLAGLRWDPGAAAGLPRPPRPDRKPVRLSDLYYAKHGGRR